MYKILLNAKPKQCENCPLKACLTKDCGTVRAIRIDSAGVRFGKEPDGRCKIKPYKMEVHLLG